MNAPRKQRRRLADIVHDAAAKVIPAPRVPRTAEQRLISIIRRYAGPVVDIDLGDSWMDIGIGHIDRIDIALNIEDEFDLTWPDRLFAPDTILAEVLDFVEFLPSGKDRPQVQS